MKSGLFKGHDRRYWAEFFGIRHYAGEVTYTVKGFLDKNRDAQQDGFFCLLSEAKKSFSQEIAEQFFNSQAQLMGMGTGRRNSRGGTLRVSGPGTVGGSHRQSVGERFRSQLRSLVQVLDSTNSWYIRCLKPNNEKAPFSYDSHLILNQLRYLGMMDIVRIKREGFPVHTSPTEFLGYYWYLVQDKRMLHDGTPETEVIESIMKSLHVSPYEWQMGRTQIFIKGSVAELLVDRKSQLVVSNIVLIQKIVRGFIKRRWYWRVLSAAIKIQYFARKVILDARSRRREMAIVVLQSFARMILAKKRVREMKQEKEAFRLKQLEKEKAAKKASAAQIIETEPVAERIPSEVIPEPRMLAQKSLEIESYETEPFRIRPSMSELESEPLTIEKSVEKALHTPVDEKSLDDLMAELDDLSLDMFAPPPAEQSAPVAKPRNKALKRTPSKISGSLEKLFKATSIEEAIKTPSEDTNEMTDLETMLAEMESHLSSKGNFFIKEKFKFSCSIDKSFDCHPPPPLPTTQLLNF